MLERIDFSRINFLIVDDNALASELMTDILSSLGADGIRNATDSDAAASILRDGEIDLLMLEWNLRPMTGIELLDWVRTSAQSPDRMLPVIMVTANSEAEFVIEARDKGVNEFLAKPFSAEEFFRRIAVTVANPRPFVNADGFFGPDRRRRTLPFDGPDRRAPAE